MNYKVTFLDFWHLSSGTGSGFALDTTVVRDTYGLPYLPGKTIKGLLREQVELLEPESAKRIFGDAGAKMASAFFSNATLDEATHTYLRSYDELSEHLFDKVTSTKIGKNGIAEDNTLREIEVVVPLTLYGSIQCDKKDEKLLSNGLQMIKQIGLNRNRGLGRCKMEVIS